MTRNEALILLTLVFLSGCAGSAPPIPSDSLQEEGDIIPGVPAFPMNETDKSPIEEGEIEVGNSDSEKGSLSPEQAYWAERVDAALASSDCPPSPVIDYPNSYYKGPLIDMHIHIPTIPDGGPGSEGDWMGENTQPILGVNTTIGDFACTFAQEGTPQVLAFFPVWEPIIEHHLEIVKRSIAEYPGLFVPFIMPPDDDGNPEGFPTVDAQELESMLSKHPGLFRGYGEIGLYARPNGAPGLPPDSQRLKDIYPVVRKHDLLVYFHLGEGQQEVYEKALSQNPDITFIFHGDQLVTYRQDGMQDLSAIDEILWNHPNAHYEVDELWGDIWLIKPGSSKEDFLSHFVEYEPLLEKDLATWEGFIEDHPDQVVWGSDRGVATRWDLDHAVALQLHDYVRAFIGRLDPSLQDRFAYKNAEKLFERKKGTGSDTD